MQRANMLSREIQETMVEGKKKDRSSDVRAGLPRKPKVMTTPIFETECLSFSPSYNLDQGDSELSTKRCESFCCQVQYSVA